MVGALVLGSSWPLKLSLLSENTEKNWLFKILALAEESWIRLPFSSLSLLIVLPVSLLLLLMLAVQRESF